jgi:hypothetical protein
LILFVCCGVAAQRGYPTKLLLREAWSEKRMPAQSEAIHHIFPIKCERLCEAGQMRKTKNEKE